MAERKPTACRFGFEKMRLHRITLWVVAGDSAARRVYEKVGFVTEDLLAGSSIGSEGRSLSLAGATASGTTW
ncbi:hypothetical protein GCM10022247_32110 [Allokutzneria multivorans]|uniref:N-acetyltransferase domain-containing protein n=2 Tax=Allokutzneria multivorans TaxID=1142134 RepID=A0ABP7S753_9PSEU